MYSIRNTEMSLLEVIERQDLLELGALLANRDVDMNERDEVRKHGRFAR